MSAVLGTNIIEFEGDGRKLLRTIDQMEKQSTASAKRVDLTWKEFTKQRMGEYMKTEGSHGAAMKRMGEEWRKYKATGTHSATAVAAATAQLTTKLEAARVKSILLRGAISELVGHGTAGRLAYFFGTAALDAKAASAATSALATTTRSLSSSLAAIAAPAAVAATGLGSFFGTLKMVEPSAIELLKDKIDGIGRSIASQVRGLRHLKQTYNEHMAEVFGLAEHIELPSDILQQRMPGKRPGLRSIPAELAAIGQEKSLIGMRLQRAELEGNHAAVLKLNKELAILGEREMIDNQQGKVFARTVREQTIKNLEFADSIRRRTEALQHEGQIVSLRQQLAGLTGDASAAAQARSAADRIALDLMGVQKVPANVIASIGQLTGQIRVEEEKRRAKQVAEIHEQLNQQMVEMTLSREQAMRFAEEAAHRERLAQYDQMLLTAEEKDTLIVQSHDLMMQRMREIDAEYGRDWGAFLEGLEREYADKVARGLVTLSERAVHDMESLFSDVFFDLITGNLRDLDDAFKSFFKSIAREIADLLAKKAAAAIISRIFDAWGGGGGTSGFVTGSISGSGYSFGLANGGVLPGHFVPLRAFATGGIVDRPTAGLIGEGRPEAVVPLPNGRDIPVVMKDRPREITIHQVIGLLPDVGTGVSPDEITTVVVSDLRRNGPIRRTIMALT